MNQSDNIPKKTKKGKKKKEPSWLTISGWVVAVLFIGGFLWMMDQNDQLEGTIQITTTQNTVLKSEKAEIENQLFENSEMLNILRSKEFRVYTLNGNQAVSPQSYAKVYLNKKEKLAYIDVQGLPASPQGKVYQLWSLQMDPFSPTNIGLLNDENQSGIEFHKFSDFQESEALGITLEPIGGSKMPTMTQIYVLDMMSKN